MATRPTRALLAVVAAVTAVGVAGCTGADQPATTPSASASTSGTPSTPSTEASPELPTVGAVFTQARTAALAAESARIEGDLQRGDRPIGIELEGVASGSNQELFLTVEGGGRPEVLTVDDAYWLGGDEAFWVEQTGDPGAAASMVGRYVPITEADAKELGTFTVRTILTQLLSRPEFTALETVEDPVETDTADGVEVYLLEGDDGAQLRVAADGSATLVSLVGPTGLPADLAFTQWGRARTVTAPDPSDVIDEG